MEPLTPHGVAAQNEGKCPATHRFAKSKQELIDETRDNLTLAQHWMKKYADMGRRDVEFQVGDLVILKLTL
ncbi:hypothetical protein ACH5RR_028262 [Cinchona calisaya]|uniref:Uncharacterized protein n=1 Tax=Cinchona calisaya TaxID=153742 RepID=A0ABD2YPM4_9GENT